MYSNILTLSLFPLSPYDLYAALQTESNSADALLNSFNPSLLSEYLWTAH